MAHGSQISIRRSARTRTRPLKLKEADEDEDYINTKSPTFILPEPDPPKAKRSSSTKSPPQKKSKSAEPDVVSGVNTEDDEDELYWQDKVDIRHYCSVCLKPTNPKLNHESELRSMDHIWSYVNPSLVCHYVFILGKEKDGKYLESKVPPLCVSCKQNVKNLNKLHNDLTEITQKIQLEAGKIQKKIEDCNFKKESAKLESEMKKAKLPFRCMSNTIQFLEQLHKLNLAHANNAPLNPIASQSHQGPALRSSGTTLDTSDVKFEIDGGSDNEVIGDEDANMDFMDNNDDQDYSPNEDSEIVVVKSKSLKSKSLKRSAMAKPTSSTAEEGTSKDGQKCPLCVRRFAKPETLRLHWWKVHKEEKADSDAVILPNLEENGPLKCNKCRKMYKHKYSLLFHLELESEECERNSCVTEFPCRICKKQFTSKKALQLHRTREHNSLKDVQFKCETCNRNFKTVGHLDRHIVLEHSEEKKEKELERPMCELCGKIFTCIKSLAQHRSIHTDEKPYICDFCGKTFRLKGLMKSHLRETHWEQATGTPRPSCKFCLKSFCNPKYLKEHMKIHTGKPAYHCDVCNREFFKRTNMLLHKKRVHLTEKKPIPTHNEKNGKLRPACKICHKTYYDRRSLHFHMKMKHIMANKRFSCDVCDENFGSKYQLRYHYARYHVKGEENPEEVNLTKDDNNDTEDSGKQKAIPIKKRKSTAGVPREQKEGSPIKIESAAEVSGDEGETVSPAVINFTEYVSAEQDEPISTVEFEVETSPCGEIVTVEEVKLVLHEMGNENFVDEVENVGSN